LTFLDAYALLALLLDEPAADEVERLLRERQCAASVVNVAEAVDVSQRVHEVPGDEVKAALEPLFGDTMTVVSPREPEAWRAADLRRRYYDRRTRPLSLADCFLVAHASRGDEVATADPPLAEVAIAEGISVVALPDSAGRRPPTTNSR